MPKSFGGSAGGSKEQGRVEDEIHEGLSEYKEGLAEFAGETQIEEEEEYGGRELMRPEVLPEVSKRNLEAGLGRAREIIKGLQGKFIGARYHFNYGGGSGAGRAEIATLSSVGEEAVIKKLAIEQGWRPFYDDSLMEVGRFIPGNYQGTDLIGDQEISSSSFSRDSDKEPFHYIAGQLVTKDDYEYFKEEVRKMLYESHQQRGAQNIYERKLPPEMEAKVNQVRFNHRTQYVLEHRNKVGAGEIELREGDHGDADTYFRGGSFYKLHAYDLNKWRSGQRVEKAITIGKVQETPENIRTGYTHVGPVKATIEPNTVLIGRGGSFVGDRATRWEDIYICE